MAMKAIGDTLYLVDIGNALESLEAFTRKSPKDLALQESWFRDAIAANPELVIAPCRGSNLVSSDERWFCWKTEFGIETGSIDVLLLSSYGRIGIVETKLSYNPQARREVIAQIMDYALTLKETSFPALPAVPNIDKSPVADVDDIQESLSNGNFLLIIAGDALDHRAIRLSQMIQSEHFTSTWDLAMVDMNLYHRSTNNEYLLVPELRGIVEHEIRQTMSVTILGESPKARVEVARVTKAISEPLSRERERPWSIDEACASLDANHNKQALRIFKHIDDSRILRVDGGKGLKQPTLSFYVRSTNEKIGTSWIESKGRDVGFSLLFRSARLLELYNATESQLLDKFRDQGFRTKSSVSKDGYVTVYLPWDTDEKVLDELIGLVTGH